MIAGRLPKHLNELQDDGMDDVAEWMDTQGYARQALDRVDTLAKQFIRVADDGLITPDELLECLKGLATVRKEARELLALGENGEPRARRICVNTQTAIRQREPLIIQRLPQTVRV